MVPDPPAEEVSDRPEPPDEATKWLDLLHDEFAKETDRACVILAAALLDSALETLLKARLVPATTSSDSLLEGSYSPLANFSARIDLAHRIGLISSRFARDLHLIRRIRNDFAHNISGCTFDDAGVRNRVTELTRSHGQLDRVPEWKASHDSPKKQFRLAVAWLQWYLRRYTETVVSIPEPRLEWGYVAKPEPTRRRTKKGEK